ncbi:MAG: DNA-protecting protein DprA, partial [Chitinophagia bacterium]|nr:DNA-protecting protein DprA [Chitinophagia bacterium]
SKEEVAVIEALQNADKTHADDLMLATGIAVGSLSSMLLQLEMQGLVTALPGKYYKLR